MNIKHIGKFLKDPVYRFHFFRAKGLYNKMPDREYLELVYLKTMGYPLNLDNPKTFNEKVQWLKLYDRKPEYTQIVDKCEAKTFFAQRIDEKYIIPTIGVWDKFESIDFDKLPEQFVLKTTHDSGGVVICSSKKDFDIKAAKKKLCASLRQNYYYGGREWPYKNVKPRILAETYLNVLDDAGLLEFKLFCFDGEPKLILLCKGKAHAAGRTNDYFDMDYNHIPVSVAFPNAKETFEKPKELDELIEIARKLSKGIPQVRVDTYVADGKIYVGEMTFYHESGMCMFQPREYDAEFGKLIKLPPKTT